MRSAGPGLLLGVAGSCLGATRLLASSGLRLRRPVLARRPPPTHRSRAAKQHSCCKAYERVQCVALEICTDPEGLYSMDGESVGEEHVQQDIAARVALVGRLLEQAVAQEAVDADAATLKVLMAPEYMFYGRQRGYRFDDVLGASRCLAEQLAALVLDSKWASWLCAFGSVVFYRRLPEGTGTPLPNGRRRDFEVFNIALLQKGGCGSVEHALEHLTLVKKRYRGGNDFIVGDPRFEARAEDGDSSFQLDDGRSFDIGDVNFGLEICADHTMAKLKLMPAIREEKPIQVQLVPSAGMTIKRDAVVVQDGGLVFQVDGLTRSGGQVSARSAAFVATSAGKVLELDELEPLCRLDILSESWEHEASGLYPLNHLPRICIYPPVVLPGT